jgi:hypothetical protein
MNCERGGLVTCTDCDGELERKRHRDDASGLCRSCSQVRRGLVDEEIRLPVAASFTEIAEAMGCSSSYVRQLYQSCLRKLRSRHGARLRVLLAEMMGER